MKLGDVIASFRRRKRIDQKVMAKSLDVSVSYLSQIENNAKVPSGKLLSKISDILEVPVSGLLFETLDEAQFNDDETKKLFKKARPLMDKMISVLLADESVTKIE